MHNDSKLALAILAIIVSMAFFFFIIDTPLPAVARFVLGVAALVACGLAIMRLYGTEGWYGIMLLRSKWGLSYLDRMAKAHPGLWDFFADVGLVIGYGSLAYFLMQKEKRRSLARLTAVFFTGAIILLLLTSIVAPLASSALFSMLSGGEEFASAGSKLSQDLSGVKYAQYFFLAVLGIGGLASLVTINVLLYAGVVLLALGESLLGISEKIMSTAPGGVPIIPGKNLPLFEGIAALAVVLLVHEACHGIVARLHRLPLKSAGVVFFGFLPFGAFVDIDEKKLLKEKPPTQNAVFVAGTAANFATALAFLALFLLALNLTAPLRLSGVFIESGSLPAGAKLLSINGAPIGNSLDVILAPNTEYEIATDKGTFLRTTDENGKIGITFSTADSTGKAGMLRYPEDMWWLRSIFGFLALKFALNFVVGSINLIPLPLFDGYHIMRNGVVNPKVAAAIAYGVAAAFAITMLPWLLR